MYDRYAPFIINIDDDVFNDSAKKCDRVNESKFSRNF